MRSQKIGQSLSMGHLIGQSKSQVPPLKSPQSFGFTELERIATNIGCTPLRSLSMHIVTGFWTHSKTPTITGAEGGSLFEDLRILDGIWQPIAFNYGLIDSTRSIDT
jgi:hypothetical protein